QRQHQSGAADAGNSQAIGFEVYGAGHDEIVKSIVYLAEGAGPFSFVSAHECHCMDTTKAELPLDAGRRFKGDTRPRIVALAERSFKNVDLARCVGNGEEIRVAALGQNSLPFFTDAGVLCLAQIA